MSRSYKKVRPKKHFVYTVEDLMDLYEVGRNTLSNWVTEGLRPSDTSKPYVFNGAEVKRFHDARRLASKATLRMGEFKCFKCKSRMFPEPDSLTSYPSKEGFWGVWGTCSVCDGVVTKRVNETDCDKMLNCINTGTSLASLDEGYETVPVGIGKKEPSIGEPCYFVNDRIIYQWLEFAGRWDLKTINAKLAAIRKFEAFCDGKPFTKVATTDVSTFREALKASVEAHAEQPLSISTVRHHASHLKSFFEWLVEQKEYTALSKSLPRHFDLPKKFDANGLGQTERGTPTLDEAVEMIDGMSVETFKTRRDRAMVAIAFLAALRADTITSLKLKHVQVAQRVVVQDAKSLRAKNGKSLRINFFPLPEIFVAIVAKWLNELSGLGFGEEDALFPDERFLVKRQPLNSSDAVPAMASIHAVTVAFRVASGLIGKSFSPHSAKHCIGALGLSICRSVEAQAAWSVNMGHENMEVTSRYYQKLPQERVDEVFEHFGSGEVEEIPNEELVLMLRYHEHILVKGTPEFDRAKKLVSEHAEKRTFE